MLRVSYVPIYGTKNSAKPIGNIRKDGKEYTNVIEVEENLINPKNYIKNRVSEKIVEIVRKTMCEKNLLGTLEKSYTEK